MYKELFKKHLFLPHGVFMSRMGGLVRYYT